MAFNAADLYTVSAGVELYNYWNPFVTKHDSSSFYNWEEDNLPLYDLEERTEYLWERFGYPSSSLPGLALCVSSSSPLYNNNVFTSLSDAIDALPEIIRMPTLIEVALSGDLGNLELKNVKCVGNGSLEIVNRVFAPMSRGETKVHIVGTTTDRRAIDTVIAGGMFNTIADTSALSVSKNTSELFRNGVATYNGVSFVTQTNENSGESYRPDHVSVNYHGDTDGIAFLNSSTSAVVVADIGAGSNPNKVNVIDTASSLDFRAEGGGQTLIRTENGTGFQAGASAVGIFTNNTLRSAKIYNCDGPIYIRGFAVQGARGITSSPTYYEDYGIDIKNSNGIVIENCGVTRCRVGGMYASNSDVTLNRRFFSARNYDTNRSTTTNYGLNAVNSTITLSSDNYAYGLDSVYAFYQHDYGINLESSRLIGGLNPVDTTRASLRSCYNSDAGIRSVNSVIDLECDVDVYTNNVGLEAVGSDIVLDGFICQYNPDAGIRSDNSRISYGKVAVDTDTALGLNFANDGIQYNYRVGYHGNGVHLDLNNSRYAPVKRDRLDNTCPFSLFAHNIGIDSLCLKPAISLNNSKATLVHSRISSIAEGGSHVPEFSLAGATIPSYGAAISGRNNSQVELLGSRALGTVITGPTDVDRKDAGIFIDNNSSCRVSGPFFIGQYGVAMYANGGSKLDFCPHTEEGPYGFALSSIAIAGIPASHTSVELHSYGPCVVVDQDSTLNMRDLGDAHSRYPIDILDTDDYPSNYHINTSAYTHAGGVLFLPNTNTDSVNPNPLQSSFASKINYTGEPRANFKFGATATLGRGVYNPFIGTSDTLGANQRNATMGGVCVQALGNSVVNVTNTSFYAVSSIGDGVYYDALNSPNLCNDLRIWSFGGGATLNCNHVALSGTYPSYAGYHGPAAVYYNQNDPVGLVPSSVSTSAFMDYPYGFSYGTSTLSGLSFRLALENGIADPLTGKAVDRSRYPQDYIGSSLGTHPDVSGLSVLDYFGSGTNIWRTPGDPQGNGGSGQYIPTRGMQKYARTSNNTSVPKAPAPIINASAGNWWGSLSGYENTGAFRLYLEPDPIAHKLRYLTASSLDDNVLYQTFSQGYHASGSMSAIDSDMINWNPTFMRHSTYPHSHGGLTASALYIGVEDVVNPENYNIRIDESASHMFANAKHCSIEFLGRPKMVHIQKSTTGTSGPLNGAAGNNSGAGFKSPHTFDLRRNY